MFSLRNVILTSLLLFISAHALSCPDGATQDDLNACMEPVHLVLERIRARRPMIKRSLLPALFFSHAELNLICNAYKLSRAGCPFDYVKCSSNNDTLQIVQTNLANLCTDLSQQRQNCVHQTQVENQRCLKSLLTAELDNVAPRTVQNDCDALYEFYACFAGPLQANCGTSVIADLVKATVSHGCSMDRLSESTRVTENDCSPADKENILECFTPLQGFWRKLRIRTPDYNKIGFPLYHFSGDEVDRMCTMVTQVKDSCSAVQRCPSLPIVQFSNALLGYACGNSRDTFLKHQQCIRECVHDKPHCTEYINGAWEPVYHNEVCLRMPQFLQCIVPPIASRCGPEAIAVLVESVRQYWCDTGSILNIVAAIKSGGVDMDEQLAIHALSSSRLVDPKQLKTSATVAQVQGSAPASEVPQSSSSPKMVEASRTTESPILNVEREPGCSVNKKNQVRQCLEPVFSQMLEVHRVQKLENYSFPLYHYGKQEILDLCDLYATSFLQCPFSMFQDCTKDYVVTAANAMLGYFCSPEHVALFHDHYDCISLVVRNRHQCEKYIVGSPLMHKTAEHSGHEGPAIDCRRIELFFQCSKQAVDRGCPKTAANIFKHSLLQFGCNIK